MPIFGNIETGDVKPDKAAAPTVMEFVKISSKTTALVDKPFKCAKAVLKPLLKTKPENENQTRGWGNIFRGERSEGVCLRREGGGGKKGRKVKREEGWKREREREGAATKKNNKSLTKY